MAELAARAGIGRGQAPGDVAEVEPAEGQGGAVEVPAPAPRARRARAAGVPAKEETGKHGLYLTDAVWERLQLEAIRKKTNVSAVANLLLDRNLPRLRIERDA